MKTRRQLMLLLLVFALIACEGRANPEREAGPTPYATIAVQAFPEVAATIGPESAENIIALDPLTQAEIQEIVAQIPPHATTLVEVAHWFTQPEQQHAFGNNDAFTVLRATILERVSEGRVITASELASNPGMPLISGSVQVFGPISDAELSENSFRIDEASNPFTTQMQFPGTTATIAMNVQPGTLFQTGISPVIDLLVPEGTDLENSQYIVAVRELVLLKETATLALKVGEINFSNGTPQMHFTNSQGEVLPLALGTAFQLNNQGGKFLRGEIDLPPEIVGLYSSIDAGGLIWTYALTRDNPQYAEIWPRLLSAQTRRTLDDSISSNQLDQRGDSIEVLIAVRALLLEHPELLDAFGLTDYYTVD